MSQQFLRFIQRGATAEVADAVAADPSLLTWRDAQGVSALLWAIYSGQALVRDYFVAEHLRVGIPLDTCEAAALGNSQALGAALEAAPATVNELAGDGWTPLHLAAAFGTPEAVSLLLARGAAVDAVSANPQSNQPLHAAAALGRNPASVELLLEAGADPNARQAGGYTAIFSAAAANRQDLCELLLIHGANPAVVNDFGQTPAALARERGHAALAGWLDEWQPA